MAKRMKSTQPEFRNSSYRVIPFICDNISGFRERNMERKSILIRLLANSTNNDPRTITDVIDSALPADTPEWSKSVFNLLNGDINSLDQKVSIKLNNNLELSLKDTAVKADEAKDLAKSNKSEIDTLVTSY